MRSVLRNHAPKPVIKHLPHTNTPTSRVDFWVQPEEPGSTTEKIQELVVSGQIVRITVVTEVVAATPVTNEQLAFPIVSPKPAAISPILFEIKHR
jgi:hypothetical protein